MSPISKSRSVEALGIGLYREPGRMPLLHQMVAGLGVSPAAVRAQLARRLGLPLASVGRSLVVLARVRRSAVGSVARRAGSVARRRVVLLVRSLGLWARLSVPMLARRLGLGLAVRLGALLVGRSIGSSPQSQTLRLRLPIRGWILLMRLLLLVGRGQCCTDSPQITGMGPIRLHQHSRDSPGSQPLRWIMALRPVQGWGRYLWLVARLPLGRKTGGTWPEVSTTR
jgi:hypothetical protein